MRTTETAYDKPGNSVAPTQKDPINALEKAAPHGNSGEVSGECNDGAATIEKGVEHGIVSGGVESDQNRKRKFSGGGESKE